MLSEKTGLWYRRHKISALILSFIVLATLSMMVIAFTARGIRDPYNRSVGPIKVLAAMIRAGIGNIGICICSADREIWISRDDGFRTVASIYERGNEARRPGIVLVHGNTAMGRRLAFYKVLAAKLAENGFPVLTVDLPGFGESDDPFSKGTFYSIDDEVETVASAIQSFPKNSNIDKDDLSIIGHSRGSVIALKAGLKIDEISNIILIGPSTKWIEKLSNPRIREYFWRRARETYRFVYGKPFPDWYTIGFWAEQMKKWPRLESYLERFSTNGHKPLMLVIGQREGDRTLDVLIGKKPSIEAVENIHYIEEFFAKLRDPKKFVLLDQSDHYCNTAESLGLVFYDRVVMNQLVHEITSLLGN